MKLIEQGMKDIQDEVKALTGYQLSGIPRQFEHMTQMDATKLANYFLEEELKKGFGTRLGMMVEGGILDEDNSCILVDRKDLPREFDGYIGPILWRKSIFFRETKNYNTDIFFEEPEFKMLR